MKQEHNGKKGKELNVQGRGGGRNRTLKAKRKKWKLLGISKREER